MKQLKDRAKKDRQEIVESKKAIVLRAELQRQVEEKMEELRLAEAARHRKIRAIGLTSTAGLLLVLSIGIGVVMLINDSYVSTYSSKPSDIAFLNENLTNTQVKGNFNTITLTYEVRRNTLEYFVLVDEQEEPDISHKTLLSTLWWIVVIRRLRKKYIPKRQSFWVIRFSIVKRKGLILPRTVRPFMGIKWKRVWIRAPRSIFWSSTNIEQIPPLPLPNTYRLR